MEAAIDEAVERFGLGEQLRPPTRVAEAWSNDVVQITTARGVFALKLFPPDLAPARLDVLRRATDFERLALAHDDLRLPQPVESARGQWLVEVPSPVGSRLARCHRWVDGTPASQTLRTTEFITAAGRYLGVLHGMHRPGGDSWALPSVDLERWKRDVTDAVAAEVAWAPAMAGLTPLVQELARDVEEVRRQRRPLRLSHRDFDPKNAVVDHDGRLVITDWDYAGPILPEVELVVAATSFASSDDGVLQFVEAYEEAGGDAGPADARMMAVEAGELDWLLRNVEACLSNPEPSKLPEPVEGQDLDLHHRTTTDLISSFPSDTAALRSWPERLSRRERG